MATLSSLWHEICNETDVRKYLIILFVLALLPLCAQEQRTPVRTPEEEASKQTEMLQRELELTQQQHDTIYKIHLHYAILRRISNTRQEALQRINAMTSDILNVLNEKQRELFLSKQVSWQPRPAMPRVTRAATDTIRRQQ